MWARAWALALGVPVVLDPDASPGLVTLEPPGPGRSMRFHPDTDDLAFPDPAGPLPLQIAPWAGPGRRGATMCRPDVGQDAPATGGVLRGPVTR
jgi:hypothetical protein